MLLKSCRCGKLIPQSVKMCEECERRQQSRHMIYNNTRRDKRAADKYDTLEAVYIKGKTYEDIVRETGCGRNSPKKWCKVMIQRLSIKLFGAKAIENDKNGVKTG